MDNNIIKIERLKDRPKDSFGETFKGEMGALLMVKNGERKKFRVF